MMLGGVDAIAEPAVPATDTTPETPRKPMTVEFQTGYPYIGLSTASWNVFLDLVNTQWNPNLSNSFRKS